MTRRRFLGASTLAPAALSVEAAPPADSPAILGGAKAHPTPFPSWPVFDQSEERAVLDTLRSGKWYRGTGKMVDQFQRAYADLTGARFCLATANGTSALLASLSGLGIEPGDEVVVPPYTFIATVNVVLQHRALPVFVDTDSQTFQMDANKIEAAISPRTRAILPVHVGGSVCDLDAILPIGDRRGIPVVEDACQAHLAEWRGRKAGTHGHAGCFSFQASKNLNCGEGGAIVCNDKDLFERCYSFHNNGTGLQRRVPDSSYDSTGANLRMPEFQAALLTAQMVRIEAQAATRTANATYLTSMLNQISGIAAARMYPGCTRNAYHLYMFRYDKSHFAGLPRSAFLKALAAEGVPASGGYRPLNTEPFLKEALSARGYKRLFPAKALSQWHERNRCPVNDRLCEEAVWFSQTVLLAPRKSMELIADAIRKIQAHGGQLAKA